MEPHHSVSESIKHTIGIFLVPKKENASGMKNYWRYMSQVANCDEEVREAIPILLKDGSNILGRGGITGIEDKRVSRQQLEVRLNEKTGSVIIQTLGVNSSFLKRKGAAEEIPIKKGEPPVELQDGDSIFILYKAFEYVVQIEKQKTVEQPPSASDQLTKKRSVSIEEKERVSEEEVASKKSKTENGEKKKSIVESKEKANDPTPLSRHISSIDTKLAALKEMFPSLPQHQIEDALRSGGGQVVNAIDVLLNAPLLPLEHATEQVTSSTTTKTPHDVDPLATPKASPFASLNNPEQKSHLHANHTIEKAEKPVVGVVDVHSNGKGDGDDETVARRLQDALAKAAEEEAKRKRLEAEAESQQTIIRLLMEEKAAAEERTARLHATSPGGDRTYLPGEKEALASDAIKRYQLYPERGFENNAETVHFRTAESQFHRLLASGAAYHVTKVEYIVNPKLVKQFEEKRLKLAERMEWSETKPILCFHGTNEKNIESIVKSNFDFSKIGTNTGNLGFYGKGIYFSEYTGYSMGYVSAGKRILLCQVLLGKPYKTQMKTGRPQQAGFDSHISADGNEIVIFSPDQILPCYVVHYEPGAARVANPFSGASGGYTAPKPAYGIGGGLFAGKRLGFPMLGAPLASPGMTFGGGGSYEEEEAEYLDEYDN